MCLNSSIQAQESTILHPSCLCSAYVQPQDQLPLHQCSPARMAHLRLSVQPLGYEHTQPFQLPPLPPVDTAAAPPPSQQQPSSDDVSAEMSIQVPVKRGKL